MVGIVKIGLVFRQNRKEMGVSVGHTLFLFVALLKQARCEQILLSTERTGPLIDFPAHLKLSVLSCELDMTV